MRNALACGEARALRQKQAMTELYQSNVPASKYRFPHDTGWTTSHEGYIYEAKKLSAALVRNPKASWFLTIYIHPVLDAKQHKLLFQKASRVLRIKGINAFWIREVLPSEKVHYHFLIQDNISREHLAKICEVSFPSRKETGWHKRILPVPSVLDHNRISRYVCKSKVKGVYRGKLVADKYRRKRHLFNARTGLKKHGTIGSYWTEKPADVWDTIKERERWIASICRTMGMEVPAVKYILSQKGLYNGQRRNHFAANHGI